MTNSHDMDTWTTRDLPVLRAIVQLVDEDDSGQVRFSQIVERAGMDEATVTKALRALEHEQPPLFKANGSLANRFMRISHVTGEARRKVGAWPSPEQLADKLIEALNSAADQTEDEEKRGWLRKSAAWLSEAGRDVLVEVAKSQITG